jgi:superfamily II DNA or RNA helicase
MGSRFVASELILHDEGLNLLFCRLCQCAINPGWGPIRYHFIRQHKGIRPAEKQVLKDAFGDIKTLISTGTKEGTNAEDKAALYAIEDMGFCPHLGDAITGYKCTATTDCRYCTTTKRTMRAHLNKNNHGSASDYRPAYVQSLFGAPSLHYFEVDQPAYVQATATGTDEAAVWSLYQASLDAHRKELAMAAKLDEIPPNMFEERMGWANLLHGQHVSDLEHRSNPARQQEDLGIDSEEILAVTTSMVAACHMDLQATDHIVRRCLYSINDRISETPLRPVTHAKTLRQYAASWARFVLFSYRLSRWAVDDRNACGIVIAPALMTALDHVTEVFATDHTCEDRAGPLQDAIFEYSKAILAQRTGARLNESPLIYFLAVDGWHTKENRWKTAGESSGILSAIVYVLRVVAARELHGYREQQRSTEADFVMIREYCSHRLTSACGGVFDEILNRRSFTMEVAKDWYGTPNIQWSEHRDAVSYDGQTITMVDMRSLMQGLIAAAEAWICRLLAVDLAYLDRFDPVHLREDLAWANAGGSIVDLNPCLQSGVADMIERGRTHDTYCSIVWERDRAARIMRTYRSVPPKNPANESLVLRQFEADLHKGDEILAQIYMLMGGGPPRSTELLGCQWTNRQGIMRNFYVIFGRLAMITMYNKSEVMANAPRVVARFYPRRVGRISLALVAELFPFLSYLQSAAGEPVEAVSKMWKRRAHPMETSNLTQALEKSTQQYLGVKLGIRSLRHLLVGIDRELIRQPLADASDASVRGAYEAQTGHSGAIEEHNYAIQLSDLTGMNNKTLRAYLGTSCRSHELYRIDDPTVKQEPTEDHKSLVPTTTSSNTSIERQLHRVSIIIEMMASQVQQLTQSTGPGGAVSEATLDIHTPARQETVQTDVTTATLHRLLRQLYGPSAEFRLGQEDACRAMLNNDGKDLFVQLPTGGGKTLLIEMAALHDRGKVNIVVGPYIALQQDTTRRLRQVGVEVRAFENESMGNVSVIQVTPEKANENAFRNYWINLQSQGRISRVFWDECHLIEMEATKKSGEAYRPYTAVLDFCAQPVLGTIRPPPRVFLSATLPLDIKRAVEKRARILDPTVIRVSTSRPLLRWEVRKVAPHEMQPTLQQVVQATTIGKVLIFVMAIETGQRLHDQFGWTFYRSGIEEGSTVLDSFITGSERILIATTAASSGLDVDVSTVILYQGAFDAVTATQQAGRAGRTPGSVARCVVLVSRETIPRKALDDNKIAWNTFIATRDCRRAVIESYIDSCWRQPCNGVEERCDNCTLTDIAHVESIPNLKVMTPRWAFDNTIKDSISTSTLSPRNRYDTDMWSTPPTKIRKLQVLENRMLSPPGKRVRTMDTTALALPLVACSSGSTNSGRSTRDESFEIISSTSTMDVVHHTPSVPALSPTAITIQQESIWDQLQRWNQQQSSTLKQQRIITALITLQEKRVWCMFCWFYQLDRHDNHTWGTCAHRQRRLSGVGVKELDMLKYNMKKHYRLSTTPTILRGIHLNCWAPLKDVHPSGRFEMQKDCSLTGLMLGVVESGLQDKRIGQQVGALFRLHHGQSEQQRAEALLRPSPDRDVSIVLWDAFLFFYGFVEYIVVEKQ